MTSQVNNKNLVEFIKNQDNNTDYMVSNCAGASLIGERGIANGKKIVTWVGYVRQNTTNNYVSKF